MKYKSFLTTFLFFSFCFAAFSEERLYTFSDLRSEMLQSNPDLLKLQQEYERALLDQKDAKAGRGPTVDLQITGTYMVKPPVEALYLNVDEILNSIQWPSGVRPASSGQHVKIYDGMENTLYNFQLSVTQPIFTWGKLSNAEKLYTQIAIIKQIQVDSEIQKLDTELETRLISLFYLNQIMKVLEEEKQYVERLVRTSEDAEKTGMLLHQDVVEAKIQAKELEIAQEDVSEQINNQLLELSRTTGIENLTFENCSFSVDEQAFERILLWDRQQTEELALSGNQLSIKMLTNLQQVNEIAKKIADGYVNWKPDVALQITGGYGGSRFPFAEPNWLLKDDYTANITIGIKTTVWDGGKRLNDVSRKMSERVTADINTLDARSSIKKNLSAEWNTADVCRMKIEYQNLKIEAAASRIKQNETLFNSGYGSETDLLSAKMDKCNQEIEKIKQQLSFAAACMTIKYLAGNNSAERGCY